MVKNAIILAAGKSANFAPFTYERPKGLFRVKGEVLIERQINQLKEAGITEIVVVIGYMKEKYFYLQANFGVGFIVNNTFDKKGNLYSLYAAREKMSNTYICCPDQYFENNPFMEENPLNLSYRMTSYKEGTFMEFGVTYSDAHVITDFFVGGSNSMAMVGCAYFNASFSNKMVELMKTEINNFGIAGMFWEEFYAKHINGLTLFVKEVAEKEVTEFDTIKDLCMFDNNFLFTLDSNIISNITKKLGCNANEISDIEIISAGLTNVSFSFIAQNIKYVYRHPGSTADSLIDRKTEVFAQMKAKELGIDKSVIHIDESGWKLSYYVQEIIECDFDKNLEQLKIALDFIHQMHTVEVDETVKNFDNLEEGIKLIGIATRTKGDLFSEFGEVIHKVELLDKYIKEDAEKLGIHKVLCHNDTYAPNYIATQNGDMYLIDWEYAGINYPINDIACILCRYYFDDESVDFYLKMFYGRDLSKEEYRYAIANIALCGFYWFCWGLYKGSVGDDDGFFFLPAYTSLMKYLDVSLENYKCGDQL